MVKNPPAVERPGFSPSVGTISWRRAQLPTPAFWSGEFHGLYSPWDCKELDMTERLSLTHIKFNAQSSLHVELDKLIKEKF